MEYPHVILYALVSGQRAAYAQVCDGVTSADLATDMLEYRRARDKGDKSLELYKFYVNALYVAMTRAVETLVMVESDTAHPLLSLLGLEVTETQTAAPVQTSSRDEWAQEARKLELQGKEEQARAIRETYLQNKPVPWTPWSETVMRELLPRALDRAQPSNKPRQTLLDYALWHGQQVWVEQLAMQAQFAPARALAPGGSFGLPAMDSASEQVVRHSLEQGWRAVALLRQRHLQPYAARNFKEVLRLCDQYGVDHRSPTGSTPLMMAARAGNAALIEALLARGADPQLEDEFGHTPWLSALNRAAEDAEFAAQAIAPLFDRIAPPMLDVQTDGRLVRLEHRQGEYWVLSLMLAGFKTQGTLCGVARPHPSNKYRRGFFADELNRMLTGLPEHLWKAQRRKRSYVNQVLARAEVHSAYQPARRLWARTLNGHYVPNPLMLLRANTGSDHDRPAWRPVYDVLNLSWVDAGTAESNGRERGVGLALTVEVATRRATAGTGAPHAPTESAPSSIEAEDSDEDVTAQFG